MLSEFRKRKFTALFHHLDLDGDGVISANDFVHYAQIMKDEREWSDDEPRLAALIHATDNWWRDMLARAGSDGAEVIELDEWLEFHDELSQEVLAKGPPKWAIDMCISTHKILDTSGDGTVNAEEYGLWLRCIGSKADPAEVFVQLDFNGDGVVDLGEMMRLYTQYMLSDDPKDPGNYLMTGEF